jgi:glycosyltransferase involved in cell wall biosynthesis
MTFADDVICISRSIVDEAQRKYHRTAHLIPNGVADLKPVETTALLEKYSLTRGRYVIQVSRLVPEKRQLDLIAAFKAARLPGWKLILVGGAQGSQRYADMVRDHCARDSSIINTGFLSGREVQELVSHAAIFALPSSHEGLPISLLEAMRLGTPIVASDIPANRETELEDSSYFPVGDTAALAQRLRALASTSPADRAVIAERLRMNCMRYNWDEIAEATLAVMRRVAGRPAGLRSSAIPATQLNSPRPGGATPGL